MRIIPLLLFACCAIAAEPAPAPSTSTPHADPPPATTAATPVYRDVQPVTEAAIRALDAKDADALFRLVSPRDLRELDEKGLKEAKAGMDGERIASLRIVLAKLATITPVYHAEIDALEFTLPDSGGDFYFQRIDGTWYITNHPPQAKQ